MITPLIGILHVTIILMFITNLNPFPFPDNPRPQSNLFLPTPSTISTLLHWTLLGRKSELLDIQCKTTAQLNLQALKRTVPVQTGSTSLVRKWYNAAADPYCLWVHRGMEAGSSELDWILWPGFVVYSEQGLDDSCCVTRKQMSVLKNTFPSR